MNAQPDPVKTWNDVANFWTNLEDQIEDRQWSEPTPCGDWNVAALVEHTVGFQRRGAIVFGAEVGPDANWNAVHHAMSERLAVPGALDGTAPDFNDMPKHQLLGLLIADLLLHSWDLARSIGADETLPSEAVEATYIGLQRMPEPMLRDGGAFAAAVDVADDAPMQEKLIAFSGRQP